MKKSAATDNPRVYRLSLIGTMRTTRKRDRIMGRSLRRKVRKKNKDQIIMTNRLIILHERI